MVMRLTIEEVNNAAESHAAYLKEEGARTGHPRATLIGVPRGGLVAAYAIASKRFPDQGIHVRSIDALSDDQLLADAAISDVYLVDDIFVTGGTIKRELEKRDASLFHGVLVLGFKQGAEREMPTNMKATYRWKQDEWVVFPWEYRELDGKPYDSVQRLIEYLGDDPTRPGLVDTPRRVLGYLDELKARRNAEVTATVFEMEQYDDLVVVRNIPFSSLCEHHMLPYHGTVDVGYLSSGTVLGLSKIPRAVDVIASGLTIQEGLTTMLAHAVSDMSKSEDIAVVSRATHTCVTMRGPRAPGTEMVASTMLGKFREGSLRAEFLSLIGGR